MADLDSRVTFRDVGTCDLLLADRSHPMKLFGVQWCRFIYDCFIFVLAFINRDQFKFLCANLPIKLTFVNLAPGF